MGNRLQTIDSQKATSKVISDENVRIYFGENSLEGIYQKSGNTHDDSGNRILQFSFELRATESPNYKDFAKLYYVLETTDLRKKRKYSWEDVQSGKVAIREWANDPGNPNDTRKSTVGLPRPEAVIAGARAGSVEVQSLVTKENLSISVALLDAKMGAAVHLYRWIEMRILIEEVN
jgi:hypothetical protein